MKHLTLVLFLLTLAALPARGQDQTSKPQVIVVGPVVTLNWNASTSSGIDHYNVYSSATSGSGYILIGTSKTLTFKDLTATAGNTYYYVVTAVDGSGNESAYSNQATAVIPSS